MGAYFFVKHHSPLRFVKALIAGLLFGFYFGHGISTASENTYIPVPKHVIYAGQVISASQLRDRKVPVSYLNRVNVFIGLEGLVGKVARTTLAPARPIPTNHVSEPDVVKINKPSIMKFSSGTLTIMAEVLPLNSAKAGEFVRARNIQTGVIVSGVAQANGVITAGGLQ